MIGVIKGELRKGGVLRRFAKLCLLNREGDGGIGFACDHKSMFIQEYSDGVYVLLVGWYVTGGM